MMNTIRLLFIVMPVIVGWFGVARIFEIAPRKYAQISFLNVGQGDATYIRTPQGHDIVIDGGPDERVVRELSHVLALTDRTIDVLIMTHSDADHSSGLVPIVERYRIGEVIVSAATSSSPVRHALDNTIHNYGVRVNTVKTGNLIVFPNEPDIYLKVLHPNIDKETNTEDSNDNSIVLQLNYGSSTMLLMGDAGKSVEGGLVSAYVDLKSTILKVGHHGSKTSSDPEFVQKVQPVFSIISAGADNRFGHPHAEVIESLKQNASTTILETKQEGTITFLFDRSQVWRKP